MAKKVRSVRVPRELDELDLSALVGECEKHLRDLESAGLLLAQGNRDAADALVKARRADLGRRVGTLVWEARLRRQEKARAGREPKEVARE
ncbi:hypothetical protein [Desulfolutivibrio sulfoxidireducens]|uniref:hypothetical protein n=1 Tax=Desulfolutivibrio sulfoxidireducens TaxID=2773299 RepID=UPI00159D6E4B|nr:hypothetical protein [Desulfolutivibrio sulfoxidireducens]QLA14736.1 hypothetical protein GD605_00515 [Desulfolutivibrio sulfoxidireducens]QLA18318.1 hypothetical protein GD604_00515 [Desulfolutivibrio sulfoxidireducens]